MIDPKAGSSQQGNSNLGQRWMRLSFWWLATLAAIVLVAGGPVPGINESHYLTKAKHAFDPSFAPGDLFLESQNAHLLATYFAGWLAQWLSLDAVAWIGRGIAWSLMAAAWLSLTRCFSLPLALSPLTLSAWYFAVEYGHWAGEWAIGGFEGKAIAYPLVLFGIAEALRHRWNFAWLWMGAAVAWHPLVGGWAGLTVALSWVLECRCRQWKGELPWLLAAAAIAMIGIFPALQGLGSEESSATSSQGRIVASQVHVYLRLSHHLCPLSFSVTRHLAATFSLASLVAATYAWFCTRAIFHSHEVDGRTAAEIRLSQSQASNSGYAQVHRRLGQLLRIAWFAVAIALIGLLIDLLFSRPDGPFPRPLLASSLLRFYWFRWSDIVVPLAWTLTIWTVAWGCLRSRNEFRVHNTSEQTTPVPKDINCSPHINAFAYASAMATFCFAIFLTLACLGWQIIRDWDQTIPAADRMIVNQTGSRRKITWQRSESNRYRDWLAVCNWIRNNTPRDSLWLTPKNQQSFKWHAERAEVVCWKDVPQDNASVVEWFNRMTRLTPPLDRQQRERGWNTEELLELQRVYGFEYVLVDRTFYSNDEAPPKLEILYPTRVDNRSFAVFRIRP